MTARDMDPMLLEEANPTGLDPSQAVGGLDLKVKPKVKRINKKGMIIAGSLLGVAAIVASATFNQFGEGVSGTAKDAVANQGANKPAGFNRENTWYAGIADKVEVGDPAAQAQAGGMNPPGGQAPAGQAPAGAPGKVPDLTGKAVAPFSVGNAPAPGGSYGANGAAGGAPSPADQAAAQAAQMAEQQKQQALSAGLSVQGWQTTAAPDPVRPAMATPGAPAVPAGLAALAAAKDDDPNKQGRKDAFMDMAGQRDNAYSTSVKTAPRSPYEVKAGAVIPAVMISGINSDLPGQVIAQVRENVWDTKTGKYLLIPQGSRLIGMYDAHVAYGQKRVLLAWNRVIFPDGSSFDLKGMPGADKSGYAGFFDQVDNHYMRIFGSAILMSMISAGVQLSQPAPASGPYGQQQQPSASQTIAGALGQQLGQTANQMAMKNLNIQPTLEIRPGYQFNVMVTQDMILPPLKK